MRLLVQGSADTTIWQTYVKTMYLDFIFIPLIRRHLSDMSSRMMKFVNWLPHGIASEQCPAVLKNAVAAGLLA